MSNFKTYTYLIMLSGGLDSTFLLYYLLTKTTYNIHVHHIRHLYKTEIRWQQELEAVKNIINYCKKYRNFNVSTTLFDYTDIEFVAGWDSDLHVQVASKISKSIIEEERNCFLTACLGWTMDDIEAWSKVESKFKKINSYNDISRVYLTRQLWRACINSLNNFITYYTGKPITNINMTFEFPLIDLGYYKKDILSELPQDLFELTWSCRNSGKILNGKRVPCGECFSCRKILETKLELEKKEIKF